MFLKSIRFKIILWYMVVLALTLSVFCWLLYQNYSRSLFGNLDELLKTKAGGVVNSIDTYWEAEKMETLKTAQVAVTPSVFSKINNINFAKIARHCIEERSGDPNLMNIVVKIFDASGRHIVSSNRTSNIMFLSMDDFRDVLNGKSRFDNFTVELPLARPLPLRVFTAPVIEDSQVAYIVQVAVPLNALYLALNRLKTILFLLMPLTVFVTGIAGALLAKITLKPVEDMIDTIRQIKADNLKLRVSIPDTKDEIKRLAETFNDMLSELERAFSSQQQFIQDVSHELRTPLTILKGEIEVTVKKIRSAQEYEAVLLSSLEEINKIRKIVDDLLLLARFDSKKIPFEIKNLDLNADVQELLNDMDILAQQKDIKINFSAIEPRIILAADQNQLRQVLANLLDNAIKYTPAKGEVSIRLDKDDRYVCIKVSDTGMGIPPEEQPFIFDRFYRVDKSRSPRGFGLGLSIVKSIVDAHQGTIKVHCPSSGGTTFCVSLPRVC